MPIIEMPDGVELEFPEGMTNAQIKGAARKHYEKHHVNGKDKDFFEELYDAATSRETAQLIGSIVGGVAASPSASVSGPLGPFAGAVLGSGAGGQIHDFVTGNAGTAGEQALKAAYDIGTEAVLGKVAPKVMAAGGQIVKRGLSPIRRGVENRAIKGSPEAVKSLVSAEKAGFKLDAGMIDNPELQQLSASLRNKPGSGSIMAKVDRANSENAVRLSEAIQNNLGETMLPEKVGAIVKKSASKNKAAFFDMADKYYGKVDKFIPDEVPATNLSNTAKGIISDIEASSISMSTRQGELNIAQKALEDIGETGTISMLQRKSIKQAAKNSYKKAPKDITDSDRSLMSLERAINKDVESAALETGGKEALKAIKLANNWWKKGLGNKAQGKVGLLDDFAQVEKITEPGKVYNWMLNEAGSGGEKIKRLIKSMPEIEGPLKATTFREMGSPTAGMRGATGLTGETQFSFSTFLTNANKLSPSARKVLFKGAGKEYKNLLQASDFIKAMEKRANFSNTESSRVWNELLAPLQQGIMYGGLGGSMGGLANATKGALLGGAVVGGKIAKDARVAQLMTDPDFVKWLANTGKKVSLKPSDAAPQLLRLSAIASGKPAEIREDLISYMNEIGLTVSQTKNKSGKVKKVEVE